MNKNEKNDILVSICCITYNHEKYIKKAIDSFLMQKTNFKFEIIIHDDASTDSTSEILKEYQKKHPNLINIIIQKENQFSKGVEILDIVFKMAKGKYIAFCEGDDYWCDNLKLQKQFDFIEKRDNCSLVVTGAYFLNQNNGKIVKKRQPYLGSRYYNIGEIIINGGILFATNSMFFRKRFVEKLPDFFYKISIGDYPLIIHLALCGEVYFLKDRTSVYRINVPNSWTVVNKKNNTLKRRILMEKQLKDMFNSINNVTNYKYNKFIEYSLLSKQLEICLLSKEFNTIKERKFNKLLFLGTLKKRLSFLIKIKFPKLYLSLKKDL